MNWALRAYARSASALIHSETLEDLVAGFCAAIVGEGEYVLAGVGLVTPGVGPVRLVAGAGPARAYFDNLRISAISGEPGGDGPAGRSIRSGHPLFMRDAATDPIFGPWREEAARFGIRSSATVPFRREGRVAGVLMIYAQTPDAFGPEEVAVFDELGGELAFAMAAIEAREQLKAAEAARLSAEAAARDAQSDLARATRLSLVGEFAATIAHEINQPIAAAATNCEAGLRWLDRDPPDLAQARQALRRGLRDAHRAAEVVQRTRALLARQETHFAPVDLAEALLDLKLFVEPEQRRSGSAIEWAVPRRLPRVFGDRVQLQQVVLNLVVNGLEAMRAGGGGTLRVSAAADGADAVRVEVSDQGPGLDAEATARLFDPFFTTKPGGVGLGLAISRNIIEAHGGRLWAQPAEGGGACFCFTLPVAAGRRGPGR
ncbi:sensor histidine kinase [Caulobacter sp. KR2-114]|uniref:sensor histidine kinase n=1 Tax=Caulobacter sp. KR2-114 TaxID=3400912 RepID=UPI003BFB3A8D